MVTWEEIQAVTNDIVREFAPLQDPGDSATTENTQHASHICDEVRQAVRTQLKLQKTDA